MSAIDNTNTNPDLYHDTDLSTKFHTFNSGKLFITQQPYNVNDNNNNNDIHNNNIGNSVSNNELYNTLQSYKQHTQQVNITISNNKQDATYRQKANNSVHKQQRQQSYINKPSTAPNRNTGNTLLPILRTVTPASDGASRTRRRSLQHKLNTLHNPILDNKSTQKIHNNIINNDKKLQEKLTKLSYELDIEKSIKLLNKKLHDNRVYSLNNTYRNNNSNITNTSTISSTERKLLDNYNKIDNYTSFMQLVPSHNIDDNINNNNHSSIQYSSNNNINPVQLVKYKLAQIETADDLIDMNTFNHVLQYVINNNNTTNIYIHRDRIYQRLYEYADKISHKKHNNSALDTSNTKQKFDTSERFNNDNTTMSNDIKPVLGQYNNDVSIVKPRVINLVSMSQKKQIGIINNDKQSDNKVFQHVDR